MADRANIDDDEEGPEEAVAAKLAKDPLAPSQAERDAHEATHLPSRSVCGVRVRKARQPSSRPARAGGEDRPGGHDGLRLRKTAR